MIRVFNLYVPSSKILLVAGDALLLTAGFFLLLGPHVPADTTAGLQFLALVLLAAVIGICSFYISDLYEVSARRNPPMVLAAGLRGLGLTALLLSPLVWLLLRDRGTQYPQMEPLFALLLLLLYLQHGASDWWLRRISRGKRVLLVGSGTIVQRLGEELIGKRGLSLKLAGIVLDRPRPLPRDLRFAVVGAVDRLRELTGSFRPDRIVVSSEIGVPTVPAADLLALRRVGIRVQDAGELYEYITGRVPVESVRANALAFGKALIPSPMTRAVHRIASSVASLLLAALLVVPGLLIAIAIKLESPGPVFYTQERVGLGGRTFRLIRFRSMRQNANSVSGPAWPVDSSPRVSRLGAVLRRLHLDELPQVVNVLRGEMCLVGPRPEHPQFARLLEDKVTHYDLRHCVRPGITGWAQVSADCGSEIDESRTELEYDLFYVKNASLLFDLWICLKTFKIALRVRGAR